jgi:hypothetical protein
LRKEANEDEDFYDRTAEVQGQAKDEREDREFRERAKGQNYEELKLSLEGLLAEKAEVNQQLAKIAQEERTAALELPTGEELDQLVSEAAKAVRTEQRQALVARMRTLVSQTDE